MDEKLERLILDLLMNQCETLNDIRKELILIREATEQANEPDPDAEPDPFQTLNGPVTRVSIDGGVSWPPE